MKNLNLIFLILTLTISEKGFGQGCETLLMNGVFNTFNQQVGNYTSSEWHQYWCNGTIEKVQRGSSSGVSIDLAGLEIPLGMSFEDANEFQRIYKSIYCGSNSGSYQNLQTNLVILKVASPEILNAYIKCKEIEKGGLEVNLSLRPEDRKVFVIDVKYTRPWGTSEGPKVKKISFVPNVISTKEGSLQDGIGLQTGLSYSMVCERSTDIPLTVMIETEVGVFTSNLPSFIPPPTEQERIMAALPRGTIIGWYNPLNLPKGWVICDGTNGSPNLNDRIPIGTIPENKDLGKQAGQKSHFHLISGKTGNENKKGEERTPAGMQGAGGECMYHDHNVSIKSDEAENLPPVTKIFFIMKL